MVNQSDEYFNRHFRMLRITVGARSPKEAHEKLVAAGWRYDPEESQYTEPLPNPPAQEEGLKPPERL